MNEQNFTVYYATDRVLRIGMSPAQDITGWTLAFALKRLASDPVALVTKTTVSGIVIVTPLTGVFDVTLSVANTTLAEGNYEWDARRTNATMTDVVAKGLITIVRTAGA